MHVVVVGCGAIGSYLVALLARMPWIARVTLVDPDLYHKSNLLSQNIYRSDVGEYKVAVQARRLRAANPALAVAALPALIEDVPLGALRSDLILACVDSKVARQIINEIAWRLQTTWIDSGVLESEQLARVNVYVPGADSPCLECAWDAHDYAALEAKHPCAASGAAEQPSDTSAALASQAASMLAIECQKMLSGNERHAAIGRQITMDARTHRLLSTALRRNPNCRFDHIRYDIVPLRCSLQRTTVAELLASTGRVRLAGHRFARQMVCSGCGFRLDGLRLDRPKALCLKCDARMIAPGFDVLLDHLYTSLPQESLACTLAQAGFRAGDVVCGIDKQFELVTEVL